MAEAPDPRAPGKVASAGDETRLPWLELGEDERGRGRGTLLGLFAAGLIVLALAAGGAWYVVRARQAALPLADGSVIRAPAGPYKQRPAAAGGSVADGTGDTSYTVAEGRPAGPVRLGDTIVVADAPEAGSSAGGSGAAGVAVQLGAFSSAANAEAQWPRLIQRYPELAPLRHRVVEARADLGSVFGLQAIAADPLGAQALCTTLRAGGLACRVMG